MAVSFDRYLVKWIIGCLDLHMSIFLSLAPGDVNNSRFLANRHRICGHLSNYPRHNTAQSTTATQHISEHELFQQHKTREPQRNSSTTSFHNAQLISSNPYPETAPSPFPSPSSFTPTHAQ